jgi:hypothetical protein
MKTLVIKAAQVIIKNIARPNVFINKEQWNVIWMHYEKLCLQKLD